MPPDTIVIHCTAGPNTSGAVSTLTNPNNPDKPSAHIVIPDFGKAGEPDRTVRLVRDSNASFHVRRQVLFEGRNNVNGRSFGVEIVHTAMEGDPYSEAQINEAVRWCRFWMSHHPIRFIVTHALLDPGRRRDPTVMFPWDDFVARVKDGLTNRSPQMLSIRVNGRVIDMEADIIEGKVWGELRKLVEAMGGTITPNDARTRVDIRI